MIGDNGKLFKTRTKVKGSRCVHDMVGMLTLAFSDRSASALRQSLMESRENGTWSAIGLPICQGTNRKGKRTHEVLVLYEV